MAGTGLVRETPTENHDLIPDCNLNLQFVGVQSFKIV